MEGLLHTVADKAAIGAAGGTEGDTHIEGDLIGSQGLPGLQPRLGALEAQAAAGGGDKVGIPQDAVRLPEAAALLQQLPGQLGRPDAGEGPPGGGHAGELPGGLEEAQLHNPLEQALPPVFILYAGYIRPGEAPGGAALHRQLCHSGVVPPPDGERHPGCILAAALIDGALLGEKGQQALLHSVAVVVALEYQLHTPIAWRRWGLVRRSRSRVERGPWPGQTL